MKVTNVNPNLFLDVLTKKTSIFLVFSLFVSFVIFVISLIYIYSVVYETKMQSPLRLSDISSEGRVEKQNVKLKFPHQCKVNTSLISPSVSPQVLTLYLQDYYDPGDEITRLGLL